VLVFAMGVCCFAGAQDFQGIYIGAYAGGNNGSSDVQTFPAFNPAGYFAQTSIPAIATVGTQNLTPSGFSGGGTFGFNLQHRALVFGAETDFGSMSMSASRTGTATYPCCAPTSFTVTQTVSTDWLYTGRGRMGLATSKALFYGTAGLAATKVNYTSLFTDTFATAHESATIDRTRKGWIGGGGVEVRLTHHWSVKGEYLYADFGQEIAKSTNLTAFTPPIAFPQNPFTHAVDLTAKIFRGGLNYRF